MALGESDHAGIPTVLPIHRLTVVTISTNMPSNADSEELRTHILRLTIARSVTSALTAGSNQAVSAEIAEKSSSSIDSGFDATMGTNLSSG